MIDLETDIVADRVAIALGLRGGMSRKRIGSELAMSDDAVMRAVLRLNSDGLIVWSEAYGTWHLLARNRARGLNAVCAARHDRARVCPNTKPQKDGR